MMRLRRETRRQAKGRKKVDKLQRKIDKAKAKGKVARVAKLKQKQKVKAAKFGISLRAVPGVARRAPRVKFRIRKGVKQRWNAKYRGWESVRRRRRAAPKISEELKSIRETIDMLKTVIGVMK